MRQLLFKISMTCALLGGLSGCALSPQTVDLTPQIELTSSELQPQHPLQLQALDARPDIVVGSRGGVYADTNLITTNLELPAQLRQASAQALTELGFEVTPHNADRSIRVYLDELYYQVPEGEIVTQIDLAATVRISAERSDGARFSGRYQASAQQQVIQAPSSSENQELLNNVLSDALSRGFNDRKLLRFLSQ